MATISLFNPRKTLQNKAKSNEVQSIVQLSLNLIVMILFGNWWFLVILSDEWFLCSVIVSDLWFSWLFLAILNDSWCFCGVWLLMILVISDYSCWLLSDSRYFWWFLVILVIYLWFFEDSFSWFLMVIKGFSVCWWFLETLRDS